LGLGSKKKVRKIPVSTRMTKQYRAISPSMNDQWSGKALSSVLRANRDAPSRSSSQRAIRRVIMTAR
jgi:hypothetical protein